MKSIPPKKLSLSRTTVRVLSGDQLRLAVGAGAKSDFEICWPTVDHGCGLTIACGGTGPYPTGGPPCQDTVLCAPASTVLICQ